MKYFIINIGQNVSFFQYLGDWYEFERFFFIPEVLLKCSKANYSMNADGTVRVINSGVNKL